jgi:predicted PhzF superfamily epimerase YddE/YHI9
MQMGRNGQVFIRRRQDSVYLGGHAVTCVDGTLAC